MKDDRKIEPEKIHLLSVRTLKGSIDSKEGSDPNEIQGHSFEFELGRGFDLDKSLIGLELKVDIEAMGKSDQPLAITGSYTHETVFRIDNLDDFVDGAENTEDISVDLLLMATLVGIAYSTIRGIIFSRTQGTSLGTVILPVVDPKKVMGMAMDESNEAVEYEKKP